MPILTRKSLPKSAITSETVEEWLTNEFEGSPIEPNLQMAKECALSILNEQREEEELEPLVRCPKEAAETTLSYIQDIAKDWNAELSEEDDESGELVEDEEDSDEGKSIIARKYKSRYRPFRMTNGDDLAQQLTAHVKTLEGDDGKLHVDRDKLERFAKLNGCWDAKYVHLNNGMVRLNVGNRLRAKVRHGHQIVWN